MDVGREIRKATETGRVLFGTEQSLKSVKTGEAKLVIMASNVPERTKEDLEYYCSLTHIPVHHYEGTSIDLGTLCGKPFVISVLTVIQPGESNLLMVEGH
ncbi:MAG: 50S ribosomal protein L30e [Theionarchaea archaeon]|nr:50S ribosomal protein L30e [Theionarchaea archaeon]MBU7038921.1 50S ribosomal protein L30e [Theionarchaea archaeon]